MHANPVKKKNILIFLVVVFVIAVPLFIVLLTTIILPRTSSATIEVRLAHSVTTNIGTSSYTFKLYPYEGKKGIYLLRVEKGISYATTVVVKGHTYRFIDLEVHVLELISSGVLLEVKIAV